MHLAQSKPGLLETLSQKTNKQVAGINPYWFCYLGPEGKWALTLSVLGAAHSYRVSLAFWRFFHLSAEMAEMMAEEWRIFSRSPDFTFLSKVLEFPQRLGHWPSDISETLRSVLALLVFLMEYTFFWNPSGQVSLWEEVCMYMVGGRRCGQHETVPQGLRHGVMLLFVLCSCLWPPWDVSWIGAVIALSLAYLCG